MPAARCAATAAAAAALAAAAAVFAAVGVMSALAVSAKTPELMSTAAAAGLTLPEDNCVEIDLSFPQMSTATANGSEAGPSLSGEFRATLDLPFSQMASASGGEGTASSPPAFQGLK